MLSSFNHARVTFFGENKMDYFMNCVCSMSSFQIFSPSNMSYYIFSCVKKYFIFYLLLFLPTMLMAN